MASEVIANWFQRYVARRKVGCRVGAVLALIGGLAVLFFTFWFTYFVLFIADWGINAAVELASSGHKWHLTHHWRLIVSGMFIVALFIEWMRRSEWDLGNYGPSQTAAGSNALVAEGGGFGAFAMILGNPQNSATMVAELLYTGPRLVLGSWHLVGEARRMSRIDQDTCATALQYLASQPRAVGAEEMATVLPDAEWEQVRGDCARIFGVLVLAKGLTLSPELRRELAELFGATA